MLAFKGFLAALVLAAGHTAALFRVRDGDPTTSTIPGSISSVIPGDPSSIPTTSTETISAPAISSGSQPTPSIPASSMSSTTDAATSIPTVQPTGVPTLTGHIFPYTVGYSDFTYKVKGLSTFPNEIQKHELRLIIEILGGRADRDWYILWGNDSVYQVMNITTQLGGGRSINLKSIVEL
ncbi:hypothetical protein HYPSUDRAFT_54294 [Hypholoma sublateritium FD-334 SS-4]|uniref:Uncharacterized protein n=1 Tax=Hypholoma sublateritium (strain FD-334 SS-4) TaxID=945553 RepID=A0A0D2P4G5_HYPSF|nr:hypothetical protein HYPSUDRAFT_54294 [Hypholoma sublateritium FD-334 SS-4]